MRNKDNALLHVAKALRAAAEVLDSADGKQALKDYITDLLEATQPHVKKQTKADAYFAPAKLVAAEVDKWPDWKKAGFFRPDPNSTKNVKAAVELSSDEKKELRKALTDAVQRTISSPLFLQQLNETADFPERFNRIGDDYATITAVIVENNSTRVVFTLGDEEWSYQLGAFSVDRV